MRVLITWGTERGGTEDIARIIGEELRRHALDVVLLPARQAREPAVYDAVIVGGALYGSCWRGSARRFVLRNTDALREIPVWFFSSGPLDDPASSANIPPPEQIRVLMERVGARGHVTFGGRLAKDPSGFIASPVARNLAGDWRDPERIRAWAAEVARELPTAEPGVAIDHPARSLVRLVNHGLGGWIGGAAILLGLLEVTTTATALAVHAIAVPLVFALVSRNYFGRPGAREPLTAAAAFTGIAAVCQLVLVAWLFQDRLDVIAAIVATLLPFTLIFTTTWLTGFALSTLPWPTSADPRVAGEAGRSADTGQAVHVADTGQAVHVADAGQAVHVADAARTAADPGEVHPDRHRAPGARS